MTNCSPRPRMRWNGAIGAIERCKRASTACALRSRSRHELHLICGEKPKAKGVIRPFKPYMRHVQDESNPVPSLQSLLSQFSFEAISGYDLPLRLRVKREGERRWR